MRTRGYDLSKGRVPNRCIDKGALGIWGEWDTPNSQRCVKAATKPKWGDVTAYGCVQGQAKRVYASRIWDAPGDAMAACRNTPVSFADKSGNPHRFASGENCHAKPAQGVWAEWQVADASCTPKPAYWGNELGARGVVRGDCAALNIRKHYARLWDLPGGADWTRACKAARASVGGYTASPPSACIDKGPLGQWGEWLARDSSCTVDALPAEGQRRAIAEKKLAAIGGFIASKLGFASAVASNPEVRTSLKSGDERTVAQVARTGSIGEVAMPDGYLLRTLTVGAVVGGKVLFVGFSGEAGAAIDLKGQRPVYAFGSGGYEFGPGLAAGGGVNVGFWVCQNNKIGGDSWGIEFGVDDIVALFGKEKISMKKGVSVAIGLWFNYDNVFQGFTITPEFGAGVDYGGYVRSSTAVDGDDTVACDGRPR